MKPQLAAGEEYRSFAVRSSDKRRGLPNASFAGQQETFLPSSKMLDRPRPQYH